MLSAVLEGGLLVMQFLLKLSDVFLQNGRLGRQSLVEDINGHCNEHLAHTFIDRVVLWESIELAGCQLIESGFSFLRTNFCLSLCDLLL